MRTSVLRRVEKRAPWTYGPRTVSLQRVRFRCMLVGLLLLAGCGRRVANGRSGDAARAVDPRPAPDAPASFVARCAACHGQHGEGDGVAAATLYPRPRNFRDPAWQRSTSDAAIRQVITEGGPARGLSALMPAQGELRPGELDELVRYLRALSRE